MSQQIFWHSLGDVLYRKLATIFHFFGTLCKCSGDWKPKMRLIGEFAGCCTFTVQNSDMNGRFSAIATGFSRKPILLSYPSQANSPKWRRSERSKLAAAVSWEYNEAVLSTGKRWFYGALDHCSLSLDSAALLYTHSTIEQIAQKCRMTTKKTGNASKYALSKELFSGPSSYRFLGKILGKIPCYQTIFPSLD